MLEDYLQAVPFLTISNSADDNYKNEVANTELQELKKKVKSLENVVATFMVLQDNNYDLKIGDKDSPSSN